MPALLLRPGLKRTAVLSLSAAGATGLSYLQAAPDTKEALQVQQRYDLRAYVAVIHVPDCNKLPYADSRCPWCQARVTDWGSKHCPFSFLVSSIDWLGSTRVTTKYALH